MNRTRLFGMLLMAAAFGCTEAATVAHIRAAAGMPDHLDYARIWTLHNLPFDSVSISALLGRILHRRVELAREAATLLLLVGAAMGSGRTGKERLCLFGLTFAVWDLTYYGWLWLFTGFPASIADTDIYFLLPIPLYGPVLLPLLGMPLIAWGSLVFLRRKEGRLKDGRPSPGDSGGTAVEGGGGESR